MKRLSTLFVVMLCVSCGREPVEDISESEVNLFGTKAGNGGLAYACQELDDLCQTMGKGCKAHQMFCANGGVATKIEDMICGKLADVCNAGIAVACDIALQHCGAGNTTPPANPPAPPAAPPAAPPTPPTPPATPPTPPATPPTPAPPAMPNMSACCQALDGCITNQTGCDQIATECTSNLMPDLSAMLQPFVAMCNNSIPYVGQMFSAACCQEVNDCINNQTGCDQAMQTCFGFSMPGMPSMPNMPAMPNMPGVPSLSDLFNQICQP